MDKKGKRRLILLPFIIVLSLTAFYFGGGFIALPIIEGQIFGRRGIDEGKLLESQYVLLKLRADYPALEKRTIHTFDSEGNTLTGYYYDVPNEKGLVLAAHGMGSCADADGAEYQNFFVSEGYDVFAIDLSGSGRSEGKGTSSLWQSAYDVKAAYDYLLEKSLIPDSFYLVGHSWGAFGVSASLGLGVKANGVISFAGYENPRDMMLSYAESYAGFAATLTRPAFYSAEVVYHGRKSELSASKAIKESQVKALLIQGEEDKTVKLGVSLYSHALDYPNVTPLLLPKMGHQGPWRSNAAHQYVDEVAKPLFEAKKDSLTIEEAKKLRSEIDLEKSSELNEEVFSAIKAFLN